MHMLGLYISTQRRRENSPGVRAIVTGEGLPLTGEAIRDRPPLAFEKVRYHGEAVALVVADTFVTSEIGC